MRRVDLVEATMQGWARLNPSQRERFFQADLKAALRLDRLEFRAWLLRRLRHPPLAVPIDPARFAISDRDMALLVEALPLRAGDADRGTRLRDGFPRDGGRSLAGRKMGRSLEHFRKEGARLIPEPTEPDPYAEEAYRLWAVKQQSK